MKSKKAWLLPVPLLLVCGMIGCGEKPETVGKKPKAVVEPKAIVSQPDVIEKPKAAIEETVAEKEKTRAEIINSIGMKLVLIPGGEFLMGSPESDDEARDSEKPQHKVRITKPFYLGVHEVTQAEYEEVMGENPSWFSKGGHGADHVSGKDTSRHPVENVSWEDATEFCKQLSAKEGKTYRLPTEAEWEYACRAGTTTRWHCGDNESDLAKAAWFWDNSEEQTHAVGQKEPNAWGLRDMHGNVWEWCSDWYGAYGSEKAVSDPKGPAQGDLRVLRGGSFYLGASWARGASRHVSVFLGGYRDFGVGFRLARTYP